MAALDGKKTNRNLKKKGFTEVTGDHNFFEFWHNGKLVTKTKTSHNGQEIHDGLIKAMSKQCGVKKEFFIEFAKCDRSKDEYINELKKNGIIPKNSN